MTKLLGRLFFAMAVPILGVFWVGIANATQFEKSPCWFAIPADREMSCGYLVVPETRSKAASSPISLAVVVFEPDKVRHEPVVFLSGGPGQPAGIGTKDEIEEWWQFIDQQEWLRGRRLIVVDQRGIGLSRPVLDCSSFMAKGSYLQTVEKSEILSCRMALIGRGIDLSAYNTWESAEDIEDLRTSLGIDRWILYGVSYGTEVAMAVLERHPEGVSGAVLDSVLPPQTDYLSQDGVNLARSISILDSDCQRDLACRGTHPLGTLIEQTVSRLDAAPVPIWLGHGHHEDAGYVRLAGNDYLEFLFNAFYDSEMLPALPLIIRKTYDQDYRLIAPYLADAGKDRRTKIFDGLDYSVTCAEAGSGSVDTTTPAYMRKWVMDSGYSLICPLWLTAKDPAPPVPSVQSDVPILFLSGEYDPATPPQWAQSIARRFPAGQSIVFRGIGHDVLDSNSCGSKIVADFLRHPRSPVHNPCLAELKAPDFLVADDDVWMARSAEGFADAEEQLIAVHLKNVRH